MEDLLIEFGDLMLKLADYIYSLTSGLINGEEEPPESLYWLTVNLITVLHVQFGQSNMQNLEREIGAHFL